MRSEIDKDLRLCTSIARVLLCVFPLAITGCGEDQNPQSPPIEDEIETNLTDPFLMMESFEKAFNTKNFEAYAAFLDPELTYCPLQEEPEDDYPWLTDSCWGRPTELGIIANLFASDYAGPGHPIFGNQCDIAVYLQRVYSDNEIWLLGQVAAVSKDGSLFESRVVLVLIRKDGFWRIRQLGPG